MGDNVVQIQQETKPDRWSGIRGPDHSHGNCKVNLFFIKNRYMLKIKIGTLLFFRIRKCDYDLPACDIALKYQQHIILRP